MVSEHHRHRLRGADCGEKGLISPYSRCAAGLACPPWHLLESVAPPGDRAGTPRGAAASRHRGAAGRSPSLRPAACRVRLGLQDWLWWALTHRCLRHRQFGWADLEKLAILFVVVRGTFVPASRMTGRVPCQPSGARKTSVTRPPRFPSEAGLQERLDNIMYGRILYSLCASGLPTSRSTLRGGSGPMASASRNRLGHA